MIPDETVEQVRDSADLVGIIGEAVELKRTGSDYRGPCPFHGGTHRNFAVIPKKGRYYCFVCHESGDVFSWLMKRFGMDYPTAVRDVARRSGIVIPERPGRSGPDPLEPLFGAVAAAQDWFTRQLLEEADARPAREYLEGRDLPLETAALLGLGFAPAGKRFLPAMETLGIEQALLLRSGLAATRDDGSVIPRFRGRLLFPIHDLRGRVVGFGGRLLGPGEPKYLNSPETEIFHKGKQLYNLHQAKSAIRKAESVILVEGYFDVVRLVLAGIEHVVAPLGTAMTPDQGALLRRYAPTAVLLYDSDQAGLRASFRAGDELLRHGIRVRVATLPEGEDPDTLARSGGAAAVEAVIGDAVDLLERKIQLLERKGWFEGLDHRRDALDRLLPTIRAASDPVTRELYLSVTSERTGVKKEVLEAELKAQRTDGRAGGPTDSRTTRPSNRPPVRPAEGRQGRGISSPETQLLQVMMTHPELCADVGREVAPELFERPALREVYQALLRDPSAISQLPAELSESAALAWSRLKESAPQVVGEKAPETYTRVVQILRARPEYRAIGSLTDPGERQRRRAELRERYPEADRSYPYWRQASPSRSKGA
jgi:DNA primase